MKVEILDQSLSKEGYSYERWLNPLIYNQLDHSTVKSPFVLRMRWILDEKSFLLDPLDDTGRAFNARSPSFEFKAGDAARTEGVDLFYGVCETPGVAGYVHSERYDDFLVRPAYDAASGKWEAAFIVTNAGCGIIATTNRVFMAPADGYRTEVAVPQEVLDHPAFTLYLRTREPRLYAMLPFSRSAHHPDRDLGIAFRTALVNPYGGRELERDGRTGKFYNDLREEALRALLVERKYPPRPDIDARMENYKKRNELSTKMRELRTKDTHVRREIEMIKTSMKGEPKSKIDKAYEKQQKWIKETDGIFREYRKELIRLEKEAHTLNLPDESQKDEVDE
ncbi:MAG: hypothetical protein IJU44_13645 [Kiritimatiellae bacterium]|nr:hypothetical protein [Kiritimatiellia bacterium]